MAELNWTEESERWMKAIHDYISQDSPAAARRTIEGIYQKAQLLRTFPECGYCYEQAADRDIRILLFGHYRIAYLIRPDSDIERFLS